MKMHNVLVATAVAIAGSMAIAGVAGAVTVNFNPGSYDLANSYLGSPDDQLVVSVSGGVASFVFSGDVNETFSLADGSTPAGLVFGDSPYYATSSLISSSWAAADYPFLTFWSTANDGGITAGTVPGDLGTNLFSTYQSTDGNGQVFTLSGVPEPATWAVMLVGLGGLGAAMRSRRKVLAVAA